MKTLASSQVSPEPEPVAEGTPAASSAPTAEAAPATPSPTQASVAAPSVPAPAPVSFSVNAAVRLVPSVASPVVMDELGRQTREHRTWLDHVTSEDVGELAGQCEAMATAFHALVPRHTLGWRTAAEAWAARRVIDVDRQQLNRSSFVALHT